MQQQTIYVTDDGQKFESESEARLHEQGLAISEQIKGFLANEGTNERKSTEYTRVIVAWESYKSGDEQKADLTAVA